MNRRCPGIGSLIITALVAVCARAQQPPVIHVSVDRVQIPVLVLGTHREDLPQLVPSQFEVDLDGMQKLQPHVRLEGDDPIDISILVDTSDPANVLTPLLATQWAALPPEAVKAQDHVSVFGYDGCTVRRARTMDLAESGSITAAIASAASFPSKTHLAADCAHPVSLWDALYYLANSMRALPGRRIVLAATNGVTSSGARKPEEVRDVALMYGVGIFTLAEPGKVPSGKLTSFGPQSTNYAASPLIAVSELSGGLLTETSELTLPVAFPRIFHLIRGRYILEFPRPDGMFGVHRINVNIRQVKTFIRAGGVTFPPAWRHNNADDDMSPLPELELPPLEEPVDTPAAALAPAITTPSAPKAAPVAPPGKPVDPLDVTDEVVH